MRTLDNIRLFTRSEWKARPAKRWSGSLGNIRSFVVHHGSEGAPPHHFEHAAAIVRGYQNFHMDTRGWNDIGYHYLIDGKGRLYQGRPVTEIGAHVLNQNSHRVGLCFLQNGDEYGMTDEQQRTFMKLLRHRHRRLGLPRLVDLARHAGDDYGVFCHREVPGQSTECCGDRLLADVHACLRKALR